jgi:hypothetical protein
LCGEELQKVTTTAAVPPSLGFGTPRALGTSTNRMGVGFRYLCPLRDLSFSCVIEEAGRVGNYDDDDDHINR